MTIVEVNVTAREAARTVYGVLRLGFWVAVVVALSFAARPLRAVPVLEDRRPPNPASVLPPVLDRTQ